MSSTEDLQRSVPTKKELALLVDETRKELHAAGDSTKNIGMLVLWSVGLSVVAFGITRGMLSENDFDSAQSLMELVAVINLGIFIGIARRVFAVGKHLRQAVTVRHVQELANYLASD